MSEAFNDLESSGSRELAPISAGQVASGGDRHKLFMQTLNEAQVDFLLQRTPRHEIKYRQGRGGLQFAYVEHGYVTERLNMVFGFNWDFEVVDKQILEEEVVVEAKLTVRTPGGQTIVKTQFGGADIKRHASGNKNGRPLSVADDLKAAASDALKKCASLLGVGLDLYGRDRPEEADEVEVQKPVLDGGKVREVGQAIGAMEGDRSGMSTDTQVREIVRLTAKAGMDMRELLGRLEVSSLDELTEAKAERVVNRLRQMTARSRQAQAS
ncbi:MAG: RAD52 family DNA repair protein [Chloroflexota bacterium]|nr:RAD52 family DNA repair protein [Chloroflexota bacterium]